MMDINHKHQQCCLLNAEHCQALLYLVVDFNFWSKSVKRQAIAKELSLRGSSSECVRIWLIKVSRIWLNAWCETAWYDAGQNTYMTSTPSSHWRLLDLGLSPWTGLFLFETLSFGSKRRYSRLKDISLLENHLTLYCNIRANIKHSGAMSSMKYIEVLIVLSNRKDD